jgi:hypothetical protein
MNFWNIFQEKTEQRLAWNFIDNGYSGRRKVRKQYPRHCQGRGKPPEASVRVLKPLTGSGFGGMYR